MAVPRRAGKYVPVYPWRGLWGSGAAARRKASARSTPEEASFLKPRRDAGSSDENEDEDEARSIHWFPYDRVGDVDADP